MTHRRTFCSMRYLTERKEPKNIGKRAIKTKLEYATSIPSGVAAALPVAFLAVSFTAADRFATVSFTTDSAILTLRCSFVRRRDRQSQKSLPAWARGCFFPMTEIHVALPRGQLSPAQLFPHYIFDKNPPFFCVGYFLSHFLKLKSSGRILFC